MLYSRRLFFGQHQAAVRLRVGANKVGTGALLRSWFSAETSVNSVGHGQEFQGTADHEMAPNPLLGMAGDPLSISVRVEHLRVPAVQLSVASCAQPDSFDAAAVLLPAVDNDLLFMRENDVVRVTFPRVAEAAKVRIVAFRSLPMGVVGFGVYATCSSTQTYNDRVFPLVDNRGVSNEYLLDQCNDRDLNIAFRASARSTFRVVASYLKPPGLDRVVKLGFASFPTQAAVDDVRAAVREAHELYWAATEGQERLLVRMLEPNAGCSAANICVRDEVDRSFVFPPTGQVTWYRNVGTNNWEASTLSHEWGHALHGFVDEYDYFDPAKFRCGHTAMSSVGTAVRRFENHCTSYNHNTQGTPGTWTLGPGANWDSASYAISKPTETPAMTVLGRDGADRPRLQSPWEDEK